MRAGCLGMVMAAVSMLMPAVESLAWNAYADDAWTGNVNVFLGAKVMDKDDWSPAHEHGEIGLLVDFRQHYWPVNIAADVLFSAGDGVAWASGIGFVDWEVTTAELNLGVRKVWDRLGGICPYIGGGLAFIYAEGTLKTFDGSLAEDDTAAGYWINGGVYWTLGGSFNLGLDLRYSSAEVTLYGVDGEAGGGHAGLILGYHW